MTKPNQEQKLPTHWIGVRKHWLDNCTTFAEALVSVPPATLKTHAYAIGATGSGKTTALHHFMSQDATLGHSFVVFDMRGDLVNAALEICAGRIAPEKIKLFDLREKDKPLGFNPLYGAGEPFFRALNVLDVVANESESFGVQLAETLRYSLLLLAEVQAPLTSLESLLTNFGYRASLLAKSNSESMKPFWERYDALSPDKQVSFATPVLNKMSLLFSTEGLRRMLGHQAPTDLGKHLNTPGTVTLISLAVDELHGAGRMMGSLFLSSICQEIFARVGIPEASRVPVRCYVDEFENFSMNDFESILAEGRRFRFSIFLANQTLGQLTPKMRSMILGNVGVKLVFRTGREDALTLSKDLTGDTKALDLANLPTGEAYLWQRSGEPLHVEINEPLFANVGVQSKEARVLLSQLRNSIPPFEAEVSRVEVKSQSRNSAERGSDSLEDWI
jgi:hypothetical protein